MNNEEVLLVLCSLCFLRKKPGVVEIGASCCCCPYKFWQSLINTEMYINECVYTYTSNFLEGHEPVLAAFPKEPVVIFEPARRTKDEKWTNLEVYKTVQNEFRAYSNKRLKTWRLEMIEKCDHFVKPNKELSCGCWQFLLFLLSYTFVICLRFIIKNLILRLGKKWTFGLLFYSFLA